MLGRAKHSFASVLKTVSCLSKQLIGSRGYVGNYFVRFQKDFGGIRQQKKAFQGKTSNL